MSSTPEATLEAVLDEVRAIAHGLNKIGDDTAMIRAHLAEIDAQLAEMPQRDEIDALRAIVGELQTAVGDLQAFVKSDPPLWDRLVALEENVAQYKVDTAAREDVIVDDAGTATDPEHREMARDEAGPLVEASEARTGKQLRTLAEVVAAQSKRIEKLVDVALENRWVTVAGVLLSAAIIYVLVQVVPW